MKTTESAEMYLETILLLQEKHPQVRRLEGNAGTTELVLREF